MHKILPALALLPLTLLAACSSAPECIPMASNPGIAVQLDGVGMSKDPESVKSVPVTVEYCLPKQECKTASGVLRPVTRGEAAKVGRWDGFVDTPILQLDKEIKVTVILDNARPLENDGFTPHPQGSKATASLPAVAVDAKDCSVKTGMNVITLTPKDFK